MRRKYHFIILLLAFVPLMVQCTSPKSASKSASGTAVEALVLDKEQVWLLVAVQGKAAAKSPEVILMFHPESGTVRGRVACNRYFADYKIGQGRIDADGMHYSLSLEDVSGGDVQCPEGDMALQERYLGLLARVDGCLLTPYVLSLYQKGKETLRFELQ